MYYTSKWPLACKDSESKVFKIKSISNMSNIGQNMSNIGNFWTNMAISQLRDQIYPIYYISKWPLAYKDLESKVFKINSISNMSNIGNFWTNMTISQLIDQICPIHYTSKWPLTCKDSESKVVKFKSIFNMSNIWNFSACNLVL